MRDGYSICFNEWALDKDIKNELGLLLIISSLCAKEGYCYADNEYFAKMFDIDVSNVSKKIKLLEEKGYISIEYKKRGCEILERKIRLAKITFHDWQKYQSTIGENANGNNKNTIPPDNNNIINNIILSAPPKGTMVKPTIRVVISNKRLGIKRVSLFFYVSLQFLQCWLYHSPLWGGR